MNSDGSLKSDDVARTGHSGEFFDSEVDVWIDNHLSTEERVQQLRDIAKLVDTTLFRAYMYASPSLAGPLFRIDNFCDPDVVNDKLLENHRYNDLVDFFYGKKLHHQALTLLKRFGDRDEEDETAPQLFGPRRSVAYLQSLPPEMIDLILDFARWPLERDRDLGMEVFLADSENAETLPRAKVLDFLLAMDPKLAVKYLEHIINELNDDTQTFHQQLAETYIQGLKSDDFKDEDERNQWKGKTFEFLRSSKDYQPYKALKQLPNNGQSFFPQPPLWFLWDQQLTSILDPHLYEARAIVLGKMGQHRQALDIYVFKLKDPTKAEEQASKIFNSLSKSNV